MRRCNAFLRDSKELCERPVAHRGVDVCAVHVGVRPTPEMITARIERERIRLRLDVVPPREDDIKTRIEFMEL